MLAKEKREMEEQLFFLPKTEVYNCVFSVSKVLCLQSLPCGYPTRWCLVSFFCDIFLFFSIIFLSITFLSVKSPPIFFWILRPCVVPKKIRQFDLRKQETTSVECTKLSAGLVVPVFFCIVLQIKIR